MTDLTQTIARMCAIDNVKTWDFSDDAPEDAFELAVEEQTPFYFELARQIIPLIEAGVREECHLQAVALFWAYAAGVTDAHRRGHPQFTHDVETFSNELAAAIRAGKEKS